MSDIELSKAQRDRLISQLQDYFEAELDHDLGSFEAGFLLDFIAREFGSIFYNQGLYDAQSALSQKVDALSEAILSLEKRGG
ncbi:MAG: hypothetical protein CMK09_06615 [Ponticaulis sp.]|nr:hypothetical protein [Ponticaulis sp.]|tara:strand:+ start:29326 stop:29571 length:246 start_codon:yes stop_codon:yes gene_type:complete